MRSTVVFEGGLGNQLFQFVFMLYLREVSHYNVSYNKSFLDKYAVHHGFEADKFFDFSSFQESKTDYYTYFWKGLRIIDSATSLKNPLLCTDKAYDGKKQYPVYAGFWQDISFYSAVKQKVDDLLLDLDPYCGDELLKIEVDASESVFLHVRRGDYLLEKKFTDLSATSYYRDAIALIKKKVPDPRFFVFSDDISWTKNFFSDEKHFVFVEYEGQNPLGDLHLMRRCRNGILANSTFSWWGAMPSEKDIVIVPKNFYTDRPSGNLYPENWISLDT